MDVSTGIRSSGRKETAPIIVETFPSPVPREPYFHAFFCGWTVEFSESGLSCEDARG